MGKASVHQADRKVSVIPPGFRIPVVALGGTNRSMPIIVQDCF